MSCTYSSHQPLNLIVYGVRTQEIKQGIIKLFKYQFWEMWVKDQGLWKFECVSDGFNWRPQGTPCNIRAATLIFYLNLPQPLSQYLLSVTLSWNPHWIYVLVSIIFFILTSCHCDSSITHSLNKYLVPSTYYSVFIPYPFTCNFQSRDGTVLPIEHEEAGQGLEKPMRSLLQ